MKIQSHRQMITMKEKLGFLGVLKAALRISTANASFVILALIASTPLFLSLLLQEIFIFRKKYLKFTEMIFTFLYPGPKWGPDPVFAVRTLIEEAIKDHFPLGLLYAGTVHFSLQLFTCIMIISAASTIYSEERPMNLKGMLLDPMRQVGFKGPLLTSIYASLLSSLTLIGLVSFFLNTSLFVPTFSMFIFGIGFLFLFMKYIEWSAIWNTGIVMSILEEKQGYIAIGVAAYITRGSRKRGLFSMLMLVVGSMALRLSSLYVGWQREDSEIKVTAVYAFLVCLLNVAKWTVITVYYYDCKGRFLEKKVDVERGTEPQPLIGS